MSRQQARIIRNELNNIHVCFSQRICIHGLFKLVKILSKKSGMGNIKGLKQCWNNILIGNNNCYNQFSNNYGNNVTDQ